jgi:hypothetical protein
MSIIERIRPKDEASRRLFPGFAAFVVALIGVGLGIVADWASVRWLGYIAFIMVAAAVLGGFIFIIWGFVTFPGQLRRDLQQFRERQQSTWKHNDWKP